MHIAILVIAEPFQGVKQSYHYMMWNQICRACSSCRSHGAVVDWAAHDSSPMLGLASCVCKRTASYLQPAGWGTYLTLQHLHCLRLWFCNAHMHMCMHCYSKTITCIQYIGDGTAL